MRTRVLHVTRSVVRRVRDRTEGPARDRGEDGFILLESLIAISLIAVVMGALASMTLNVVTGTNELRARQGATQLATSTMAAIGAVPASDLRTGRDSTSVDQQLTRASDRVRPWLAAMTPAVDSTPGLAAGAGATATVPTAPVTQTLNSIGYSVETYLGSCVMRSRTAGECEVSGTGTPHLRAVVAVSWTGRGCRVGTCTYVTATLVNAAADPVFNTNRATPPSKPVVADPGPQVSTRGSAVSVRFAVVAGTGLAPLTWQVTTGALPTGLTLSADGLVSGTPTTVAPATPLTVTVSDAFGRTATADLTWRIVAPPSITTPPNQSTVVGQAVNLAVASTCPNTPCTFAVTGAPAGLGIDAATGVISGTPTTVGTSASVTVTVTDAGGVPVSTNPFTWRVLAPPTPPTISGVGAVLTTVGVPTNDELPFTCPAAPCTVTLTGSVPGLGLSTTNGRTGTNTTTSLTVNATSGSVWISGTVAASAVPSGRLRTYSVVARITDSGTGTANSSGTWTATTGTLVNYAAGRPASQSSTYQFAGPELAVDRNTDGVYANGSVTHTNGQDQPWWQVDLGASTTVRTVTLYNRTDCCADRLANGQVFLSASDMAGRTYAQLLADPAVTKVAFSGLDTASLALSANDVRGRYVRVQLAGSNVLSLAEVQVWGPNLAAGRTTDQSSTGFGGSSSRAVDGNTDGVYNNGSVTHTDFDNRAWWQVELETSSIIDAVTVWNRTDCCADRLNGAVLLLSATDMGNRSLNQLNADASITKIPFGSTAARTIISVGGVSARFIRVQLPNGNDEVVSLAEVQVNGRVP